MERSAKVVVTFIVAVLTLAPLTFAGDVQGKVQSFDRDGQRLRLADGTELVVPPGLGIKREDLQPGDDVKVTYEESAGQKVITSLEILTPDKK